MKRLGTDRTYNLDLDRTGEEFRTTYLVQACAISVLSKYLGYDMGGVSKKIRNNKSTNPAEFIPCSILEIIENFAVYGTHKGNLKCFCSKPDYYYSYSLVSLLIHLNDCHRMTFTQIGDWLENIDM